MGISRERSALLFERAVRRIPGGVNSPVRAWRAVGLKPLFIERAQGAYVFDADGNRFIDYVGAFGPAIVGHAHPRVVKAVAEQATEGFSYGAATELELALAEEITRAVSSAEEVRLVNSGTEAAMTAIRIARAATSRPKIVKFEGCYHGHSDGLLVRAGSGALTFGVPDSAGVPPEIASLTLSVPYNKLDALEQCLEANRGEVAAIIVEPVAANMGVVRPEPEFLSGLQDLARRFGCLLICDEVITGFRLCYGAFSETLGLAPDLILLGKVIGGGMPIGAVAGRRDLMELLAPCGPVYQAGTLAGNPLSVRAGLETLALLREPGVYERLDKLSSALEGGIKKALDRARVKACVNRAGSLLTVFFGCERVSTSEQAREADTSLFARFFAGMLEAGVFLPASQFEAMFVSLAHSEEDIERTVDAAARVVALST